MIIPNNELRDRERAKSVGNSDEGNGHVEERNLEAIAMDDSYPVLRLLASEFRVRELLPPFLEHALKNCAAQHAGERPARCSGEDGIWSQRDGCEGLARGYVPSPPFSSPLPPHPP